MSFTIYLNDISFHISFVALLVLLDVLYGYLIEFTFIIFLPNFNIEVTWHREKSSLFLFVLLPHYFHIFYDAKRGRTIYKLICTYLGGIMKLSFYNICIHSWEVLKNIFSLTHIFRRSVIFYHFLHHCLIIIKRGRLKTVRSKII